MRKYALLSAVSVAVLALAGCTSAKDDAAQSNAEAASESAATSGAEQGAAENSEWPKELTLALIPNEKVNDLVTTAEPLTKYLSDELGIPVTGVVTKDYQAAVEAIGSGQAQIAIASAAQLAAAEDMYGAHPILQDVRFGASSYAGQFLTNNPDKYCEDEPVLAEYSDGNEYLYCNGVADGKTNSGEGPVGLEMLKKIEPGTKVAFLGATSPAGYQLPVMALESQGLNIDDLQQVPVTSNDASVMAVYNGDAEVGFSFWDARSTIDASEVPDVGEKVVVFGLTEMYPNGGVVVSDSLPADLRDEITTAMEAFSEVDPETLSAIFDITNWVPADPAAIEMARKVNDRFASN